MICKSAWRPPTPRSPHRKHREKWRPDLFHTPALHSGGNRVAKRIWPGRAMWTIRARALTPNRRVRDGDEPRCPTRRRRRRRTSLSSSLPLFHRYSGAACGAQRRVQGGGVRGIVHTTTSVPRRIRPSSPTETGRGAPAGAGRRRPPLIFIRPRKRLPTRAPRHLLYIYSEPFAFQNAPKKRPHEAYVL